MTGISKSTSASIISVANKLLTVVGVALSLLIIVVASYGFYNYSRAKDIAYRDNLRIHSEAMQYLAADVCSNSTMRAKIHTFNMCAQAERVVATDPKAEASHTAFVNTFGCSSTEGWCAKVYDDLHMLVKVTIMLLTLSFACLLWCYITVRNSGDRYKENCHKLPTMFTSSKKLV